MQPPARFDVLVIGSGASGLAAAVAADRAGARVALATKGSIQANNSSKAQGGIQAAFGADDSPALHAEDVMRSSHETADPRLVEILTGDAQARDPLARGARVRVHARERWLPPRALRRRLAQAAAPGRRPHRARDHEGAARGPRGRLATSFQNHALAALEPTAAGWRASFDVKDAGIVDDRRGHGRARRRRALLRRGQAPARALDEPPERDGRGDDDRARPRRRGARPRRAAVPPERRRLAGDDAGLLDPRDDARLRRRAPERRGRGVHRLARPARRRLAGDLRRGRRRPRRRDRGRPPGRLPRHDPASRRPTPTSRCRTCCGATAAPGSTR